MWFSQMCDSTPLRILWRFSVAPNYIFPETSDNLMLLGREFGKNSLIMCLVPQRYFPRREENIHQLFQELDRSTRGTAIKVEFQSIRDDLADVQRRLSMIEEKFDAKLEQFCQNWKR
jgi:hypothetical protein